MSNASLTDEDRDILFQAAYLLLKSGEKKRWVRSRSCEGLVTMGGSVAMYGTAGIQFDAKLGSDRGEIKVSYMVRTQDLEVLEQTERGAWLCTEDLLGPAEELKEKMRRPNPIRQVARA